MERSLTDPPRSLSPASSSPRLKRLRGVVAELQGISADGLIDSAGQLLPFRAIDVVGSRSPQIGEALSFILISVQGENRAIQVVLDSDPQYIPGQSTLSDCYQAQAKQRAARQHRLRQDSTAPPADQPDTGLKYLRCDDCQKLVLPKLRRKRSLLGAGSGRWLHYCPQCNALLDEVAQSLWHHPLLLMLLLAAVFSWWRW